MASAGAATSYLILVDVPALAVVPLYELEEAYLLNHLVLQANTTLDWLPGGPSAIPPSRPKSPGLSEYARGIRS